MIYPVTYLGPISWYRRWLDDIDALIEQFETYPKQTIRNRCQIVGPNGVQTLTIPVERLHDRKIMTRDIHIIYQEDWQHNHWQALQTAYRNSAFYNYYIELFEPFYNKRYDYLIDFNIGLMEVCLKLLDKQKTIQLTNDYIGISDTPTTNNPLPTTHYYQVFQDRHGFQPDMSILDLLFNMGQESYLYL